MLRTIIMICHSPDLELETSTTPSTIGSAEFSTTTDSTTETPVTTITTETPPDIPENFLPFGFAENDTAIVTGDDDSSDEIILETEFVLFGRNHTSVFVSIFLSAADDNK